MCDQTEVEYLPDQVVWVKLSNFWWPAQVQDISKLPEDVTQGLRKTPIAVVKFLNEDSYEFIKNIDQIYHYNSLRKFEFIKKGLVAARSAGSQSHMKKFPEDVVCAEELTGGDKNILSDPQLAPEKKYDYKELFATKKAKQTTGKPHISSASLVSPRVVQHVKQSTRMVNGNSFDLPSFNLPSNINYVCAICDFMCARMTTFWCHKQYFRGHYPLASNDSSVRQSKFDSKTPNKRKTNAEDDTPKKKTKHQGGSPVVSAFGSDSDSVKKVTKKKRVQSKERRNAVKKKEYEAVREQLLQDWEDEEDSENENVDQSDLNQEVPNLETPDKSHEIKINTDTDNCEVKKSCFDFEENDEALNLDENLKFGQKLPRVIANEKPRVRDDENTDLGLSKTTLLTSDDTLEEDFNNLLEETQMAALPSVPEPFLLDSSAFPAAASGKAEVKHNSTEGKHESMTSSHLSDNNNSISFTKESIVKDKSDTAAIKLGTTEKQDLKLDVAKNEKADIKKKSTGEESMDVTLDKTELISNAPISNKSVTEICNNNVGKKSSNRKSSGRSLVGSSAEVITPEKKNQFLFSEGSNEKSGSKNLKESRVKSSVDSDEKSKLKNDKKAVSQDFVTSKQKETKTSVIDEKKVSSPSKGDRVSLSSEKKNERKDTSEKDKKHSHEKFSGKEGDEKTQKNKANEKQTTELKPQSVEKRRSDVKHHNNLISSDNQKLTSKPEAEKKKSDRKDSYSKGSPGKKSFDAKKTEKSSNESKSKSTQDASYTPDPVQNDSSKVRKSHSDESKHSKENRKSSSEVESKSQKNIPSGLNDSSSKDSVSSRSKKSKSKSGNLRETKCNDLNEQKEKDSKSDRHKSINKSEKKDKHRDLESSLDDKKYSKNDSKKKDYSKESSRREKNSSPVSLKSIESSKKLSSSQNSSDKSTVDDKIMLDNSIVSEQKNYLTKHLKDSNDSSVSKVPCGEVITTDLVQTNKIDVQEKLVETLIPENVDHIDLKQPVSSQLIEQSNLLEVDNIHQDISDASKVNINIPVEAHTVSQNTDTNQDLNDKFNEPLEPLKCDIKSSKNNEASNSLPVSSDSSVSVERGVPNNEVQIKGGTDHTTKQLPPIYTSGLLSFDYDDSADKIMETVTKRYEPAPKFDTEPETVESSMTVEISESGDKIIQSLTQESSLEQFVKHSDQTSSASNNFDPSSSEHDISVTSDSYLQQSGDTSENSTSVHKTLISDKEISLQETTDLVCKQSEDKTNSIKPIVVPPPSTFESEQVTDISGEKNNEILIEANQSESFPVITKTDTVLTSSPSVSNIILQDSSQTVGNDHFPLAPTPLQGVNTIVVGKSDSTCDVQQRNFTASEVQNMELDINSMPFVFDDSPEIQIPLPVPVVPTNVVPRNELKIQLVKPGEARKRILTGEATGKRIIKIPAKPKPTKIPIQPKTQVASLTKKVNLPAILKQSGAMEMLGAAQYKTIKAALCKQDSVKTSGTKVLFLSSSQSANRGKGIILSKSDSKVIAPRLIASGRPVTVGNQQMTVEQPSVSQESVSQSSWLMTSPSTSTDISPSKRRKISDSSKFIDKNNSSNMIPVTSKIKLVHSKGQKIFFTSGKGNIPTTMSQLKVSQLQLPKLILSNQKLTQQGDTKSESPIQARRLVQLTKEQSSSFPVCQSQTIIPNILQSPQRKRASIRGKQTLNIPSSLLTQEKKTPTSNVLCDAANSKESMNMSTLVINVSDANLDQANAQNLISVASNSEKNIYLDSSSDLNNLILNNEPIRNTPVTRQDILAKALANTQVLQPDSSDNTSLDSNTFVEQPLYAATTLSHNALETSLTLNQPIMTPAEVSTAGTSNFQITAIPSSYLTLGETTSKLPDMQPSMPLLTDDLEVPQTVLIEPNLPQDGSQLPFLTFDGSNVVVSSSSVLYSENTSVNVSADSNKEEGNGQIILDTDLNSSVLPDKPVIGQKIVSEFEGATKSNVEPVSNYLTFSSGQVSGDFGASSRDTCPTDENEVVMPQIDLAEIALPPGKPKDLEEVVLPPENVALIPLPPEPYKGNTLSFTINRTKESAYKAQTKDSPKKPLQFDSKQQTNKSPSKSVHS